MSNTPISRIRSTGSLSSGKWRAGGKPEWWAYYTDETDTRVFLNTHGTEGREELDVAVQVPVGTTVRIGIRGFTILTETVISEEIPEEWK